MSILYLLGVCQKLNTEQLKMYLKKMVGNDDDFMERNFEDIFRFQNFDREIIDFCVKNKYGSNDFFKLPNINDDDRIKYINNGGFIDYIIQSNFVSEKVISFILNSFEKMMKDWRDWGTLEYYFEIMNDYFSEYNHYKKYNPEGYKFEYKNLEKRFEKIKEKYVRLNDERNFIKPII